MPRRKKKSVIDATNRPEAPAKVELAADKEVVGAASKIVFAVTCLNHASALLLNRPVYEVPIESEDPPESVSVKSIERRKMAVKAVQRSIEICERILFELGEEKRDESNSW